MEPNRPLPNIWASDIQVEAGLDFLRVTGTLPYISEDGKADQDLFHDYAARPGYDEKSSHIQFANSVTDQELVKFVRKFGPVAASEIKEDPGTITALQSMEGLRREWQIYASALALLATLGTKKDPGELNPRELEAIQNCISQICSGCGNWPAEWENEANWRRSKHYRPPSWRFSETELDNLDRWRQSANTCPDPKGSEVFSRHCGAIYCGHSVICTLVNAFIPEVQYGGYEAAAWEITPSFGVRPILYYILRQEYLRRGETRLCANVRCNKFFSVERSGQRFCDEDCSRKQRQREYWSEQGATHRKKRLGKQNRTRTPASRMRKKR